MMLSDLETYLTQKSLKYSERLMRAITDVLIYLTDKYDDLRKKNSKR